jgi:hypothetical protein
MNALPFLLPLVAPAIAQTCGINGATPGMIGGCLTTPSYGQPTYRRLETSPVNRGVIQVAPGYGLQPIRQAPVYSAPQIQPIWSH